MTEREDDTEAVKAIKGLRQKDEQDSNYPIRLVKDRLKRSNVNGVPGPQRLRPRRDGQGRKPGGLVQSGRTINELVCLQGISLTGNGDSLVSDGGCKQYAAPRTSHTRKHFLARASRTSIRIFVCCLETVILASACHVSHLAWSRTLLLDTQHSDLFFPALSL